MSKAKVERLHDGHVKPRIGTIEHTYDENKVKEKIHFQYQSISDEYLLRLGELLTERNVQPHMVEWENFIVGGDHGQGAFRVSFRCIVKVFGSKDFLYKTASVSDAYCRKDTGEVLKQIFWIR